MTFSWRGSRKEREGASMTNLPLPFRDLSNAFAAGLFTSEAPQFFTFSLPLDSYYLVAGGSTIEFRVYSYGGQYGFKQSGMMDFSVFLAQPCSSDQGVLPAPPSDFGCPAISSDGKRNKYDIQSNSVLDWREIRVVTDNGDDKRLKHSTLLTKRLALRGQERAVYKMRLAFRPMSQIVYNREDAFPTQKTDARLVRRSILMGNALVMSTRMEIST